MFCRPDLGPNCLQRLSADNKSGHKAFKSKERVLKVIQC